MNLGRRMRIGRSSAARGWTVNEIPSTPESRTVIGIPSTLWVGVCGGKATGRRAESRQARPRRGHLSGTEVEINGEASAAPCVGTKHRGLCLPRCARAVPLARSAVRPARRACRCTPASGHGMCSETEQSNAGGDAAASTTEAAAWWREKSAAVTFELGGCVLVSGCLEVGEAICWPVAGRVRAVIRCDAMQGAARVGLAAAFLLSSASRRS